MTRVPSLRALAEGAGAVVAAVPGAALAAGLGATAVLRRDKPLHPVGRVGPGTLALTGADTGVPFLDAQARHDVTARFSWATGTGPEGRDVHGLAIRLMVADSLSDWLLASTGADALTRYVLTTRRPGEYGTLTTLLPVRSPAGPLLLRAEPLDAPGVTEPPARHALSAAIGSGDWTPIGTLEAQWGPDVEDLHFEPVRHPVPGCTQYPAVTAVREPSYLAARLLGRD